MKQSILSTAFLICLVLGVLGSLSGCGGSSVNFATWQGNFAGTVTLDNSKTGNLTLTSDANGLVSGVFVVTGADGTDTLFKFTAGTYHMSGGITSTSGGFEVDGAVPNMGNFFIRGQLPTDSTTKTIRVITGTSSFFTTAILYQGTLNKI
jgi:hypothetical protein